MREEAMLTSGRSHQQPMRARWLPALTRRRERESLALRFGWSQVGHLPTHARTILAAWLVPTAPWRAERRAVAAVAARMVIPLPTTKMPAEVAAATAAQEASAAIRGIRIVVREAKPVGMFWRQLTV